MRGSQNFCQGGVQAWLSENSSDNVFLFCFLSLTYLTVLQRVSNGYFKENYNWGGPAFSREGGPNAYFYRNQYNLWFSRGSGPPNTPSGSTHAWPLSVHRLSSVNKWLQLTSAWVKVIRIIPQFRIFRLTFHKKSVSKSWIKQILIAFFFKFIFSLFKDHWPFNLEIVDICRNCRHTVSFKIWF